MKKIKKNLLGIFGSFIAYLFSYSWLSAQGIIDPFLTKEPLYDTRPVYGVEHEPTLTLWEKTVSVILSPLIISTAIFLAFSVGIAIYFLRKRKKKKNKNTKS